MEREFIEEDYLLIETLLRKYHDGDSEALGILLEKIEPLIASTCKHYFGFADEDLLQSGRVCCIESIQKFDFNLKDIKFLGYQKRQLKYFYCDLKRAQVKRDSRECLLSTEGSYLMESLTYDELGYNKVEVKIMLGCLNYKERYIVEHNILTGETLKDVAKHLDINYDYAKELKKKP